MKLTYILLLITFTLNAQPKGMVLIEGEIKHQINVQDSISEVAVKEFLDAVKYEKIDYQPALREVKNVVLINRDRDFVSDFHKGNIRLNSNLNEFPYCKKAAIWQELFIRCGGKINNKRQPQITSNFNVTKNVEALFKRQSKYGSTLKTITRILSNQ